MRAKIWVEVMCDECGDTAAESGFYKNSKCIAKLKEEVKDWTFNEKLQKNLCPECIESLKNKNK